jgi:putative heme iron utilization protein
MTERLCVEKCQRFDYRDILFTVLAQADDHICDFNVFEISNAFPDKDGTAWNRAGANCWPNDTDNLEDAELFLSGHVKWDACSNWNFDAQESCMIHFCEKQQAENIGVVLGRLYDIAAELIPNWNG